MMTKNKNSGLWGRLWGRTKEVVATYTGTFIVVMILNQLLFFGFCLNPICIIAAMPHVLLITVFVGTLINKIGNWGERGLVKRGAAIAGEKLDEIGNKMVEASENFERDMTELRRSHSEEIKNRELERLEKQLEAKPTSNQPRAQISESSETALVENNHTSIEPTTVPMVKETNTARNLNAEEPTAREQNNRISVESPAVEFSVIQGHQKVYITKSRLSNIVYALDPGNVSKISYGDLYTINLKHIFSQKELALLSVYKEMCRDAKQALQSYKKAAKKNSHNKYVFDDVVPAYHVDKDCDLLRGDYYNLEIPIEILHRGDAEIARFKEFCKINRNLIADGDPIVLKKLEAQFMLQNPPKEISARNSGIEAFANMNLNELEFQIEELLTEADLFRNSNQNTFRIIREKGYGAHTALEAKDPSSPLYTWHNTYKVPIKDLLMHYFRVKFNPNLGFDGHLLDQLGFKPCSNCS